MYFDCILFLLPTPVRLFLLLYLLNFMSFPLPSKNTKKKIKTNKQKAPIKQKTPKQNKKHTKNIESFLCLLITSGHGIYLRV